MRALTSCPINQEDAANSPWAIVGQAILSIAVPAIVGAIADETADAIDAAQRRRQSASSAFTSLNLWVPRADDDKQLTTSFKCIVIVRGNFSRLNTRKENETQSAGWLRAKTAKENVWTQDQTTDLNSRLKSFYDSNPQATPLYLSGTPELYIELPVVSVPLSLPKDTTVTDEKGNPRETLGVDMVVPMTLALAPPTVHYYVSGARQNGRSKSVSIRLTIDAVTIEDRKAVAVKLLDRPFGLGRLPIGSVRGPEHFADFPVVRIAPPPATNASFPVLRGKEQLFANVVNPIPLDISVEVTESEDSGDIERKIADWLRRKETKDTVSDAITRSLAPVEPK